MSLKKNSCTLIFILGITFSSFSQTMNTTTYRNTSIPFTEVNTSFYNFSYPIISDILNSNLLTPPDDGLYLKATYGHRYLSSSSARSDNHGGFDYWPDHSSGGVDYDENNKVDIVSMCDGVISEILNGTDQEMEQTSKGRSVQVKCTKQSQVFSSDIYINYRHLSSLGTIPASAENETPNTIAISKGDVIGKMGESGSTSNVHLHLSAKTDHPTYGSAYIHTARLFDPNAHTNILAPLTDATIKLLHTYDDKAVFRITWPYNQTITRFEFINGDFTIVFDKEEAYEVGSSTRDGHDPIDGIKVYAYQFNGKQTASHRYDDEMNDIPAVYPASPLRDADLTTYKYNHFPITDDSLVYVYDFVVENLPQSFDSNDFKVKLSDVWGYTVEGSFETLSIDELQLHTTKAYPNPTPDILNLDFNNEIVASIKLFDSSARLLHSFQANNNSSVDLRDYATGIYYLKVEYTNRIETLRVIKN